MIDKKRTFFLEGVLKVTGKPFESLTVYEKADLPVFLQIEGYQSRMLISKMYTEDELYLKKEYFLSLPVLENSIMTTERFHAEVTRKFQSHDLRDYPDLIFLILEEYRKRGSI